MDEAMLIRKAQAGDQKALARLLHDNYRVVLGYLIKITLNKAVAEDVVQDTMVRAIEKISYYNGKSKFSTWLITIATNLYRDQLRRKKIAENALQELDSVGYTLDGDISMRSDLEEALLQLKPEKRIALVLKYFYDYSYDDIAAATGVPIGTVRSRLHNGMNELKGILGAAIILLFLLEVMFR